MPAQGNYILESDVSNWPSSVSATNTFLPSAVDVTGNIITTNLDIATGSIITITSTITMPSPLEHGQKYYAIRVNATSIKVALNPTNAAAGIAIDITSQGTGIHTVDVGEGSSQTDRQRIIDMAEQLIESVTKDIFYEKDFEITQDGNGKDRLLVGIPNKILSITEIEIAGIEMPVDLYVYNERFVYLNPEIAVADEVAEYHYRIRTEHVLFPTGKGNIKITGTCGHLVCPPAIRKATIVLCEAENDPTLYQKYSPLVSSETLGEDYSYNRKPKHLTGIIEADRLIMPFVKTRSMLDVL